MKKLIIITALISLFCTSCFKDEIDLNLNNSENQKLVVNAWITDLDKPQFVELSLTTDYLEDQAFIPVENATVSLSDDIETIVLENTAAGLYYLPESWKAIIGTTYTLTVIHEDKTYIAISTMRPLAKVTNIRSKSYTEDSLEFYDVYFDFTDLPGEGDGYFAIDYKKNSNERNTIRTGGWTSDEIVDGIEFKELTVTSTEHMLGDTVILEFHSIGAKATEYLDGIVTEIFREGLFDPPPVNVQTNLTEGAVGYFIMAAAEKYQIIIGEDEVEEIENVVTIDTSFVKVGPHQIFTLSAGTGNNTFIFESGLGDDMNVWIQSGIVEELAKNNQVIIYNRAGYAPSDFANNIPRDINQLSDELNLVIESLSQNEEVILIGHSLGGAIIRNYAIQHPDQVAAMLFVDPSHEGVENLEDLQEIEDNLIPQLLQAGQNGVAAEIDQLVENFKILISLPNLPDLPVHVLTGMAIEDGSDLNTAEELALKFEAHATLGTGITNFTHLATTNAGHHIHLQEPQLVLSSLKALAR